MEQLNSWDKELDKRDISTPVIMCTAVFILFSYLLLTRLASLNLIEYGLRQIGNAAMLEDKEIVDKSLYYQRAFKAFTKAYHINPFYSKPYFECAEVILYLAASKELMDSLDTGQFKIASNIEADYFKRAKFYIEQAIKREPTHGIYHQRLAMIYLKLNDAGRGEEELNKAITLDPQNVFLNIYLAKYYFSLGKEKEFNDFLSKIDKIYRKMGASDAKNRVQAFFKSVNREVLIRR